MRLTSLFALLFVAACSLGGGGKKSRAIGGTVPDLAIAAGPADLAVAPSPSPDLTEPEVAPPPDLAKPSADLARPPTDLARPPDDLAELPAGTLLACTLAIDQLTTCGELCSKAGKSCLSLGCDGWTGYLVSPDCSGSQTGLASTLDGARMTCDSFLLAISTLGLGGVRCCCE